MNFTKRQKEIINLIANKKISNIQSFQNEYCDIENIESEGSEQYTEVAYVGAGDHIYIPQDNINESAKLKDFFIVWNTLENNNLILSSSKAAKDRMAKVFIKNPKFNQTSNDSELDEFIIKYGAKSIIPTPELQNLIDREFLTLAEYNYELEKQERKKSQRITIAIAILIPLITLSINTYFNYEISSTDKESKIKITNPFILPDTVSISLTEPIEIKNLPIDSTIYLKELKAIKNSLKQQIKKK